ncbi:MAG: ImpA family metalloprotease, partial [Burkholderiales bacterium]
FLEDIKKNPIGWFEIKTPGMEIHSIRSKAIEFLEPPPLETYAQRAQYPNASKPYFHRDNGIDMNKYLFEAKKYVMEEAYQFAGLQVRGVELKPSVLQICGKLDWDCTSTSIHVPPVVQHFHIDMRATCGALCSGQPIDSSSGFAPRSWGISHEMGHNLQRFKVYYDKSTEVSNNIVPLHMRWQLFRDLGRTEIGYENELLDTHITFGFLKNNFKNTSLATREAKIAKTKADLWTLDAGQNRQRLHFYSQWPLIYHEVLKEKNPMVSEELLWEQAWDVFTLMYLNLRQIESVSDAKWPIENDKLGFGSYTQKPATSHASVVVNGVVTYPHHDYLLVMLSKLTGRDQRPLFDFWGIETYAEGRNQVQSMQLPAQPVKFYTVVCSDDFRTRRVIDMNAPNPSLPAEWGAEPFKDQASNWAACQAATAAYESSR